MRRFLLSVCTILLWSMALWMFLSQMPVTPNITVRQSTPVYEPVRDLMKLHHPMEEVE